MLTISSLSVVGEVILTGFPSSLDPNRLEYRPKVELLLGCL